jgi:hypothetical protein
MMGGGGRRIGASAYHVNHRHRHCDRRCPLMLNPGIFFLRSFLITSAWMADNCHGGVPFNSADGTQKSDGATHLADTSSVVSVVSCPILSTLHFAPVVCTIVWPLNVRMLNVKYWKAGDSICLWIFSFTMYSTCILAMSYIIIRTVSVAK